MSTTTADSLVGAVLDGRYRVVRRLARGGMSTVYVGHDVRLDRAVAIKVMSTDLSHDAAFERRFTREARAAAKIWHPNVVAVHDQGSDQDLDAVFLVMELVDGHTLRALLRERDRLSPAEALAVVEPLLTGLSAAHGEGLVHRDIKPENVLIASSGRVLVVDFGLARAVAESSHTTHSGMGGTVFGTVAYLSPEQVQRGFADARSDVYAVGVLLFELLTGAPPYVGDNAVSVAYRHVNDDVPPPSELVPDVPGPVDDLVIAATNRDPGERPVDAAAMLVGVRAVQAELGWAREPVPVLRPGVLPPDAGDTSDSPTPAVLEPGEAEADSAALTHAVATDARAHGRQTAAVDHDGDSDDSPDDSADDPLPKYVQRLNRRRRRRWVLPLVAAAVVLALVGGATFWWLQYGRWTAVPDLAAATSAQEVSRVASDAGLDVDFRDAQYSETVREGQVISARPAAGTRVHRNTDVVVVMSKGPERYTVAKTLIGVPTDQASKTLQQQFGDKIVVTTSEAYDDSHPAGTVSGFAPPAGTPMKRGATVVILVSRGPTPVAVPDVATKSVEEATATLQGLKFVVQTAPDQEFSDTVPAGAVTRTDPAAGQQQQPGQTVTLVVSKGPDVVEVPNVVGKSTADATAALQAAGFQVKKKVVFSTLGVVADQTPAAGTQAKRGSTVTISVV